MRTFRVRRLREVSSALAFAAAAAGLIASLGAASPSSGDAANGKVLFEKRCTGCHSLDMDKEGPRLRGVYGRPAGTVASFQYSDAFRDAHFTWDEDRLERWLTDTQSVLPGTEMDFRVVKADERTDIIAYLRSLSEKK